MNATCRIAVIPDTSSARLQRYIYIGYDESEGEEKKITRGKKKNKISYSFMYIYTKVKQSEKEEIPRKIACLHRTHARLCLKKRRYSEALVCTFIDAACV